MEELGVRGPAPPVSEWVLPLVELRLTATLALWSAALPSVKEGNCICLREACLLVVMLC